MARFFVRCFGFFALCMPAMAQDQQEPVRMMIYPAAAPEPALRYRLFPSQADRSPGNAAITYYRSFSPEWQIFVRRPDLREKIPSVLKAPLNQVPKEMKPILESHQLKELDRAARQEYCDWELLERVRHEGIHLLLPEMVTFRQLGQCLALRARLQLAQGRFEECLYSLQSAFSLGHDLGNAPLAINALVGIGVATGALNQVRDFVQQPQAPNLYWALATIPRPFIDWPKVIEGEQLWLYAEAPALRGIENKRLSPEEYADLRRQMLKLAGLASEPYGEEEDAALTRLVLKQYPEAKRDLIAEGRKAEDVNAMTALQVCVIYSLKQYRRLRDDFYKWFYVPAHWTDQGLAASMQTYEESWRKLMGEPFTWGLWSSSMLQVSSLMTDREIAVLQVIEALRLYAAVHGSLPDSLEAIREVPVPCDPVTGKPFSYKAEGEKATVSGPRVKQMRFSRPLLYELKLAKAAQPKAAP
jgi:hypothetical protein